jgi:hypothetical protein
MLVSGLACLCKIIVGPFIKQAKYELAINFGGQVSNSFSLCIWQLTNNCHKTTRAF